LNKKDLIDVERFGGNSRYRDLQAVAFKKNFFQLLYKSHAHTNCEEKENKKKNKCDSGRYDSRKHKTGKCESENNVFREMCFRGNGLRENGLQRNVTRGNGPRGNENTGSCTIPDLRHIP
jgi:hypothetical protein